MKIGGDSEGDGSEELSESRPLAQFFRRFLGLSPV